MDEKLQKFMDKIKYQFKDIQLLKTALSHRSHGKINNERLEFLGDSIVNFVAASELFNRFAEAKEGQLSRLRSYLVKGDTLAEIAKEFEFGDALRLGIGESKSGGALRISILADTVEAVIGAIYLDSNMEVCYERVADWYSERINDLSLEDVHKDPKSLLQEFLQAKQLPLPEYKLASMSGEEHSQVFLIECHTVLLDHPVKGEGTSRRRAEQEAADNALKELENVK
jgi:ribonuclease III